MEVERRMRFSVIGTSMTRKGISASTFPGILDAPPYLHAGYQCCAACAFGHLYTSFPNWQRGEACAKDNNLYPVWGDDSIKKPSVVSHRFSVCTETVLAQLQVPLLPLLAHWKLREHERVNLSYGS